MAQIPASQVNSGQMMAVPEATYWLADYPLVPELAAVFELKP